MHRNARIDNAPIDDAPFKTCGAHWQRTAWATTASGHGVADIARCGDRAGTNAAKDGKFTEAADDAASAQAHRV